jgi:hypothetical protein
MPSDRSWPQWKHLTDNGQSDRISTLDNHSAQFGKVLFDIHSVISQKSCRMSEVARSCSLDFSPILILSIMYC